MKVKDLIKHQSKYPANLEVSVYRHPVKQGMRIMAPSSTAYKYPNHWLYSHKRLFIPVRELIVSGGLPPHYKVPKIKTTFQKQQRLALNKAREIKLKAAWKKKVESRTHDQKS